MAEGSIVNLKFVRFQNVSALTVCLAASVHIYVLSTVAQICVVTQLFVSANQGGEDTTKINYVEIIGSTVATTKMSDFKRVCHSLLLDAVPAPRFNKRSLCTGIACALQVAGKEGETDH